MARQPACLPKGTRISDHVTLGVLTATVPGDLIDAVLADTGKQNRQAEPAVPPVAGPAWWSTTVRPESPMFHYTWALVT